ncbi:CPBP family intramembrane glutamic endopeptidase [Deinococcus yavapaiensis]|uniref:CPBP family intramembrane glutamic endopeptidase n=1 Tax=Deinococcus yavapaiensis TaxID=309889 RepID=UPI0014737533|nr:CPBP family intramembrane glutamic endopeptidase [Deinococcus yavapaiensis]
MHVPSARTILLLASGHRLTGWHEELWSRGLILRLLSSSGVRRAVVVSSLLFAALHLGNVLYREPLIVAARRWASCAWAWRTPLFGCGRGRCGRRCWCTPYMTSRCTSRRSR